MKIALVGFQVYPQKDLQLFDKYIGLKYKNLGRSFDGVDCFGLICLIYAEERNTILPDFTELRYSQDWYKEENHILDNIWTDWKEINSQYKIYDGLLFYNSSQKIVVNHIGIYIGNDKFLHIQENQTSMISRLDKFWTSKLYKGLRWQK